MKQQIKSANTSYGDINVFGYPEKHIREYLEFDNNSEAFEYMDTHKGYWLSGWTKDSTFRIAKDYLKLAPTFENKARIRLAYCMENKVYTICACCGKELHENNKETHTQTKWGMIGPECIKKVVLLGIDFQ